MSRRLLVALSLAVSSFHPTAAQVDGTTIERLAGLGKLWGAVKFFHPYLAYKRIDWDTALVKAIPGVKAARTPEEYGDAIDQMLQALDDPATRVDREPIPVRPAPSGAHEPTYFHMVDDYLVIDAIDSVAAMSGGSAAPTPRQREMLQKMSSAKGIVLDVRIADDLPSGSVTLAAVPMTAAENVTSASW